MNPEPTDLNDLAALARTTKSARLSRAATAAVSEIERLRAGGCARDQHTTQFCAEAVAQQQKINALEARVKELEGIIDWHIDEVIGDAWVCHIEGDLDAIENLLTSAVGKHITAFHIDTSHHENTHE